MYFGNININVIQKIPINNEIKSNLYNLSLKFLYFLFVYNFVKFGNKADDIEIEKNEGIESNGIT